MSKVERESMTFQFGDRTIQPMTTQNFQQFLFSEKHSRKSLKFIFTFLNTIDEHLWTGWATLAINGVTNKFICRREKREREKGWKIII